MLRFWSKYKEDIQKLKKQKQELQTKEDEVEEIDDEPPQTFIFDREDDTRLVDNDLTVLTTPKAWFTDSIINRFIEMIYKSNIISCGIYTQRDIDSINLQPTTMRNSKIVFIYSTFFYKVLFDANPEDFKDAVKHNTKKLRNVDVTCCDKVIIPVNIENLHWAVIVVHENRITYFDSIINTEDMSFEPMLRKIDKVNVFMNFLRQKQGKHPIEYEYEVYVHKRPQKDSYSCGVYVCHRIYTVMNDDVYAELEYHELESFRKRIANYLCGSEYIFN